jgi:hypothetical protein
VPASLTDLGPLQRRAGDAEGAMGEAERLRAEAEAERDGAARSCKRVIEGCVDDDLKDQGGFWGWVKHTFKKIAPILAAVAAVVGIAALFIPGLNLLALGLAVACLVVDSANYFVFHQGDLTTVLLDLVGVAAFAGALKAARAASTVSEARAGEQAVTTVRSAVNVEKTAASGRSGVKLVEDAGDVAARRVDLRVPTKAKIQADAPKTANGDFIDPNTGKVLPKDGPFDYGHKPGHEWWRTQERARSEGWTRKQVIEHENNPSHYRIEDPSTNRSHRFEKPKGAVREP